LNSPMTPDARRAGGRGGRPRAMRSALVPLEGIAETAAAPTRTAMTVVNFMMPCKNEKPFGGIPGWGIREGFCGDGLLYRTEGVPDHDKVTDRP